MENNNLKEKDKLGPGIIAVSTILITLNLVLFIASIINIGIVNKASNDSTLAAEYASIGTILPSMTEVFISIAISAITLIGIIMILRKYKIGIFLFILGTVANTIINIIYSINDGSPVMSIITSLILPILLIGFCYNKINLFTTKGNSNA